MSRSKKTRTSDASEPKFSGQRKESSSQAKEARGNKRKSKLKGNKAGARNVNESKQTQQHNVKQVINEKRLGSQKAIPLVPEQKQPKSAANEAPKAIVKAAKNPEPKKLAPEKLSPEKELASIENDERLNDLLEQLDTGEKISKIDQSWVDQQTKRHQKLMKELGWLDDDGEEDLLQQFEDASSALDEFRH
ncbi:Der GTPase-activating protein YihI [Psychromonas antarctica]|jgi:ribosome assembly protein YihI (activator of Der GTPase)|uniref:Der GTPase-activating protein YihI n=1 Tax=Psychromonas antarctica TaxID=67573 RepID=UPI001EE8DAEC|nr:Der GTPase-activating protein YihI [Psychromonas antarctica]MCG6201168.1 GTPase-activating protein [Psychromonas antarctica]